jgi:hypothetical protein
MRKNKLVVLGMLVCALGLGLVVTGCGDDDGGGGLPEGVRNETYSYDIMGVASVDIVFTANKFSFSASGVGSETIKNSMDAVMDAYGSDWSVSTKTVSGTVNLMIKYGGEEASLGTFNSDYSELDWGGAGMIFVRQ